MENLNKYEKGQVCILADKHLMQHPNWAQLCLPEECPILWLEVDEPHKCLETVTQIWDFLMEHEITRQGVLVCIGGGVLTDIGGFAASTYKRGIDYINVPTTLLAMIDASTGGKTGFNYRGLKNSIGVFAEPVDTVIDPQWLRTLPPQQLLSGFAEMLKTGLIAPLFSKPIPEEELWTHLLQYDLDRMDIDALTPLIGECLKVKKAVVAADPQETDLRKVLNFGHTFGHALEELSLASSPIPHGYAVLHGMVAELYLSVTKLYLPKDALQQVVQIMLHYYGKPQCKCTDVDRLIALMQQDKKNEHARQINCTLLDHAGYPVVNQSVSEQEAREAWDYLFSL